MRVIRTLWMSSLRAGFAPPRSPAAVTAVCAFAMRPRFIDIEEIICRVAESRATVQAGAERNRQRAEERRAQREAAKAAGAQAEDGGKSRGHADGQGCRILREGTYNQASRTPPPPKQPSTPRRVDPWAPTYAEDSGLQSFVRLFWRTVLGE